MVYLRQIQPTQDFFSVQIKNKLLQNQINICYYSCNLIWLYACHTLHLDSMLSEGLDDGSQITGTWQLKWNMTLTHWFLAQKYPRFQQLTTTGAGIVNNYWLQILSLSVRVFDHSGPAMHQSSITQHTIWSIGYKAHNKAHHIVFSI